MNHQRLNIQRRETTDPWACRCCGHREWEVADSRLIGDARKRERVCLSCGEPMRTLEVPVPEGCRLVVVPETSEVV